MKNLLKFMAAALLMLAITTSCKKHICSECSVTTDAPGASEYYTYCGTEHEVDLEDIRLKNGCVDLQADYPQYSFNCGCN